MKDVKFWLERLRVETEELRLISNLATTPAKRDMFSHLADLHQQMADDLQTAIRSQKIETSARRHE